MEGLATQYGQQRVRRAPLYSCASRDQLQLYYCTLVVGASAIGRFLGEYCQSFNRDIRGNY